MPVSTKAVRLILGDQLSRGLASLRDCDQENDLLVMAEVMEEASYVRHHKKKLVFVFSAMRHFARDLEAAGYRVRYLRLDDPDTPGSLDEVISKVVREHRPERVVLTEPGEYRVLQKFEDWREDMEISVVIREDDRFIASRQDFADWAGDGRKNLRMEFFYREMRRRTGYLMDGDKPVGGSWNYDAANRKPIPKSVVPPERPTSRPDEITREVIEMVGARFADNFGDLEPFDYPVTRRAALHALHWFVAHALEDFGTYQDAMREGDPLLFHAHLSALINIGLLDPREVCDRAIAAYEDGAAPLNAVEGFVRQIIGWREFIRGVYWREMPGYATRNALEARRALPDFFWTAETEMNCLAQSIGDTRAHAYAHHIQRLMVIGNFCLLAGIDPRQVQEWFLLVYHDAYEWVELPNVSGMALYADGGVFASKPYAASGAYIHRMSDYCGSCAYDVKARTGEKACPFNALYWNFIEVNRDRLASNTRMAMPLKTLERFDPGERDEIAKSAAAFLETL
ncbi:cryptochrome/photolyase family protein [Pelagibacterium montanilacus]|uniref:cryptochrome/photolyase family protein n=1 Tax=Pelagibacterium montanilacus TaxID=2185280 RepID=UPI000F8D28AD|nr:cryptochrome/photolyase family protein [Pelagibacterium montanilacus]